MMNAQTNEDLAIDQGPDVDTITGPTVTCLQGGPGYGAHLVKLRDRGTLIPTYSPGM